uniref:Nucleolar protein 8 n=1 Tax=Sphenodon punctatus TaxID=8508 RepID=A0A8D0G8X3_SPHPU
MEQKQDLKRLYVGGLGHTICEAELQERFSRFGNVSDTEIVTRKDEKGNPTKTFAYVSLSISDTQLKKCMSILNKTKWKGGTLQIELAKESFLHRLAQERQEASEKKEKPQTDGKKNLLESLRKAGVVDFHMKAVPGTEIPDHKNWVVGKFGRVLPVLHIKSRNRSKTIKYDPSKYCHNLKKLEQDFTEAVPISGLTWHLEEGDISKKQEQLPKTRKQPEKKLRVQNSEGLNKTELNPVHRLPSRKPDTAQKQIMEKSNSKSTDLPKALQTYSPNNIDTQGKKLFWSKKLSSGLKSCRNAKNISDSDFDSEDEIRAIIEREMKMQEINPDVESEHDNLEIVGDNFELKYKTHWSLAKQNIVTKVSEGCNGKVKTADSDTDYDSADTDDIIAVNKTPIKSCEKSETVNVGGKDKVKSEMLTNNVNFGSADSSIVLSSNKLKEKNKKVLSGKRTKSKASAAQDSITNCKREPDHDLETENELETSESDADEDYEAMMQNCYHLDLTLDDLQRLATESIESSEEDTEDSQRNSQCKTNGYPISNTKNIPKTSNVSPTNNIAINPEDIIAAILEEEEESDETKSKKNISSLKFQPFRGIVSLCEKETPSKLSRNGSFTSKRKCDQHSASHDEPKKLKVSNFQYSKNECKEPMCKSLSSGLIKCFNSSEGDYTADPAENKNCSTTDTGDSEEENNDMESLLHENQKPIKDVECLRALPGKPKQDEKQKQLQDNQKRLAALQERQRERELQKKLVQGALSNLDGQSASKHKHIVFDSDGESEDEVEERPKKERNTGELLEKEFSMKTSGKLFESSEDEQDVGNDDRFKIKPQFEGKCGEKLLRLQSRFGTDERFRMDARFLESDSEEKEEMEEVKTNEEEEFAEEKKKNLEILERLLHTNIKHPKSSKQAANSRKFKDINALRYDPTRQDHALFEKKAENAEKESKAKKKKKREEAEKLPEVSKEIYYDIAVDLKEAFGSTNCAAEKNEEIPWDKHDDVELSTPADPRSLKFNVGGSVQEESSGFTFSFFGTDMDKSAMKEEPYIIETIKPTRVAWQEDPRFQDSSSEEEEELEVAKKENPKEMPRSLVQTNCRFFFFSKDDDRLKEGPKFFCRSSNLDEDQDFWEATRRELLEECQKKHKDARRKVKAKQ